MKQGKKSLGIRLFKSREISGVGSTGTLRLLRGRSARVLNFIGRCLSYTSARSYGSFLLSFGIVSLLLRLGEYYFRTAIEVSLASLITCLVLAAFSIPLLIVDKPICILFQDIPITDHIFFEFLSVKRMHRNVKHVTVHPLLALFIGFIPAVIAFFIPLNIVILAIILVTVVSIALTSPEFSMMLTFIVLPYIPALPHSVFILCCLTALTLLSYGWKVILGKRVFNLDVYSIIILALALVTFISGIVSDGGGAFKNSLAFIALLFSYFPISNMISNRRLADNAINAIIISAIPIMVLSVIEFIIEHPKTSYDLPSYSTEGTSALFSSPGALAAFMLVAVVSTLAFAIEKRNRAKKTFYVVVSILELAVLGILLLPEAWLAVVISALAYPVIKSKRMPLELIVVLTVIPLAVFLAPAEVLDRFSSVFGGFSLNERLNGYKEAFGVFLDHLPFGTGIGASAGIFNTALGVAAQLGVGAILLVTVFIVLRLRHQTVYKHYLRHSLVVVTGEMTMLAITALLSFGMLYDIFSDMTVLYIFWSLFGISSAALGIAKRESDDRQGYYGDSRSSESSALDLALND